ncbi:MAG: thiosulfohydrolase SoxB [Hyphomicrobiaceae bacterium]|nr:MAG: thiosulfohydrolase SoxB [Hyphomicrobiaceae bacterium]
MGLSRREFLEVAAAAAVLLGGEGRLRQAAARQSLTEADLLKFEDKGQVTILHFTDCHAQLVPHYFREPSVNLGVGEARGLPPHLTGKDLLTHFGIEPGTALAYALSSEDFSALARTYGKIGGFDRIARLIKAIRERRGADKVLLLEGGDAFQGSYTSLVSKGGDMARVLNELAVDATTGHWEFTLGEKRVTELFGSRGKAGQVKAAFLAGNVVDDEWQEPVFDASRTFTRNGVRIAVIGQAFPFTAVANPRWMVPKWSFGIREQAVRASVARARKQGAEVVVLLSHNGFDVDRKLAARVPGIDVILTAHTHDAMPAPQKVGKTLLIASGSSGKFLSRLDLELNGGKVADYSYSLIPILSDAITPDPGMEKLVAEIRAPHEAKLKTAVAHANSLLYRRGNFGGTWDDLICNAMLAERDAEIALSPGFRWGGSVLPDSDITWEDVFNVTAITYPKCYRITMTGARLKETLEDVADNLFHPDPYYQQGGDMVRAGGIAFTLKVDERIGRRIDGLRLTRTGAPIEPGRSYVVAGWGSVSETVEGPPIWDLIAAHLGRRKVIEIGPSSNITASRQNAHQPAKP